MCLHTCIYANICGSAYGTTYGNWLLVLLFVGYKPSVLKSRGRGEGGKGGESGVGGESPYGANISAK